MCPRDFYFLTYLEEEAEFKDQDTEKTFRIVESLCYDPKQFERVMRLRQDRFWLLVQAMFDNCLKGKVMTPNQWLETAFHLCKQRWDQSIDWMETLPMSKINAMIEVQSKFAEEMRKDAKDRSKRS